MVLIIPFIGTTLGADLCVLYEKKIKFKYTKKHSLDLRQV